MNFKKLISTSVLMVATICYIQAQTRVIAHRGFWKTEGSAQNSIAALQKADSIGCYGSEFDVWMTKDNQLVVNHDANFKSKSMEKSNGKELMELQLDNGEKLPSLKQYLKAGKKVNTRLILELKSEWIEELHKLGMKVNVWTVNKAEDMQWLIDRKVDFITTNEPLVLQQLLK